MLMIHISLLTFVLILIFGTIFFMMKKSYHEQSLRMMLDTVNMYSRPFDREPKKPNPLNSHYALFFIPEDAQWMVLEDNITLSDEALDLLKSEWNQNEKKDDTLKIEETPYRYLRLSGASGEVIILMDIQYEIDMLQQLALILLLATFLSLLVLFFVSIYLVNKALAPVAATWEKQKQFIADASHELKTPLTIIQTNTSVVLANENAPVKDQKKWLLYIQEETKRMAKLINHLIYLAKVDAKEDVLCLETFDLSHMLDQTLLSFEAVLFEKKLKLETHIKEEVLLHGDKEKIKQLLIILLDNAVKNTPPNESILITLTEQNQKISYSIENTGVTIPQEECDKIFERFYRVDTSRIREKSASNSYGLGLSIAKAITTAHHGQLFVKSHPHSVSFHFVIPVSINTKVKNKITG